MIIGFAGPAGSGKTTAAKIIGGEIHSFATPLKQCLKDLFRFTDRQLYTLEGKEEVDLRYGVSPRTVMQRFGTEFVRSTVPDLWVVLMKENLRLSPYKVRVIDDIRFPDEAKLIRDLGGTVVHIQGRCLAKHDHASEKALPISEYDLTISNSGSLEEFEDTVLKLGEYLGAISLERTQP